MSGNKELEETSKFLEFKYFIYLQPANIIKNLSDPRSIATLRDAIRELKNNITANAEPNVISEGIRSIKDLLLEAKIPIPPEKTELSMRHSTDRQELPDSLRSRSSFIMGFLLNLEQIATESLGKLESAYGKGSKKSAKNESKKTF